MIKTQNEFFYDAEQKSFNRNKIFLHLVETGLTKQELEKLIIKNPQTWGRFSNWTHFSSKEQHGND